MEFLSSINPIYFVFAAVLVVGYFIYSGLVRKKNDVENSFASIDVILKKRYDLIPNLIATVKQYMAHESETLTKITELRAKATDASATSEQKVQLNNQLNNAMGGLMIAVEDYPDLKANDSFKDLQRSMNEIEEQLSAARRAYNAMVTEFNNGVEIFPSSIVAKMLGYKRRSLFEIPDAQRQNYNAKELFNG